MSDASAQLSQAAQAASPSAAVDFLAGTIGGIASLLAGHPFDTIKTRLQAQHDTPSSIQSNDAASRASSSRAAVSTGGETSHLLPQSSASSSQHQHQQPQRYRSGMHAFRTIVAQERFIGLYKGVTSPMLGVALMNAAIFGAYSVCLGTLESSYGDHTAIGSVYSNPSEGSTETLVKRMGGVPSLTHVFLAGCGSGLISAFITAPIDLIKIQEQMDFSSSSSSHRDGANVRSVSYSIPRTRLQSLRDATMTTVRTMKRVWRDGSQRQSPTGRSSSWLGGVRAMYRGLSVTCMRDLGYGPYFFCYEATNRLFISWHASSFPSSRLTGGAASAETQLSNIELAISGALAGCIAWASTFPLDVIKTRIQAAATSSHGSSSNTSFWSVTRQTYRQEGVGAFFKGLGPTLLRAIPANAVLFVSFEATKAALIRAGL